MISLSTVAVFHVVGEEEEGILLPVRLQAQQAELLDRFGLSYRMGFNIKTSFRNFGRFSVPNPRFNLDGDPYNYDNGYVYPDAGTPNSGLTRYWGYDSSSQLPGNGTILMQRTSSPGFNSGDREDDPQSSIELTYNRELGRNRNFRWGLEAAFNYLNLSVNDHAPLTGNARQLTDAYPLLVPENLMPPAGYQGREYTPGVVIGASPQSSSQSFVAENVAGARQFDADIFGFRLGPYLEIPVNDRISVELSGGLSLAEINSDFQFTESITVGPATLPTTGGSGSHSDLLAGGYVAGNVSFILNRSTSIFAGAQFQDLGQYSHRVNGREAVLDLSKSLFVTLGLSYSF